MICLQDLVNLTGNSFLNLRMPMLTNKNSGYALQTMFILIDSLSKHGSSVSERDLAKLQETLTFDYCFLNYIQDGAG